MLPNALIIGAQKAATSWFAACLREHPDVFMAKMKEIYFFNDFFEKGLAWYESHFDDWSGQAAVCEATPGYLSHPAAPGRIQATLGQVKLIASLRHPVDRAYSAFWHYLGGGYFPADADFRTVFQHDERFELRSRGYYYVQLSRYLTRFPREDLLILIYEEMVQDRQKAMADCLGFLGVDTQFVPQQLQTKVNESRSIRVLQRHFRAIKRVKHWIPPGLHKPLAAAGNRVFEWFPRQRNFVPLTEDIRQELLGYYIDDIRKAEDLLQRDLSVWYKPSLQAKQDLKA